MLSARHICTSNSRRSGTVLCSTPSLTDALAYDFLLVGTLAGYLQEQGTEADLLRGHLQSPDDRYVNQEALDLPAGLMGRPLAEGERESTWHFVGR
jgi:hypothetical protein